MPWSTNPTPPILNGTVSPTRYIARHFPHDGEGRCIRFIPDLVSTITYLAQNPILKHVGMVVTSNYDGDLTIGSPGGGTGPIRPTSGLIWPRGFYFRT